MKIGFGVGINRPVGRALARIITATTAPALGPLTDGDQVQDGLPASATDTANYASTAGTITGASATVTINGSAGTLTSTVATDDVVTVEVDVTDDAANSRTFSAGTRTVQAPESVTFATRTGAGSITFEQIAESDLWTAERNGAGSITFTRVDELATGQRVTEMEA